MATVCIEEGGVESLVVLPLRHAAVVNRELGEVLKPIGEVLPVEPTVTSLGSGKFGDGIRQDDGTAGKAGYESLALGIGVDRDSVRAINRRSSIIHHCDGRRTRIGCSVRVHNGKRYTGFP